MFIVCDYPVYEGISARKNMLECRYSNDILSSMPIEPSLGVFTFGFAATRRKKNIETACVIFWKIIYDYTKHDICMGELSSRINNSFLVRTRGL